MEEELIKGLERIHQDIDANQIAIRTLSEQLRLLTKSYYKHKEEEEKKTEKTEKPSNIVKQIIIGVLGTAFLGLSTLVGDILYNVPSPQQQKIIKEVSQRLKLPSSKFLK